MGCYWRIVSINFYDLTKLRAKNSKNDKEFPLAYLYPRIQENLRIPIIRKFIMENAEFGDKDQYLEAIEPLTKINWDFKVHPLESSYSRKK